MTKTPDLNPLPDFTAWLETEDFELVFQNYAVIVYERGHLRVSVTSDRGRWYVTVDNARKGEYLADAYDADVWRAYVESAEASTTGVTGEEMASMVVRNLDALTAAVAPESIAGVRAGLDEIAKRRFIASSGEESWRAYQRARDEMRRKRA